MERKLQGSTEGIKKNLCTKINIPTLEYKIETSVLFISVEYDRCSWIYAIKHNIA